MQNFDHAVVYDIETFPNVFTLNVQGLFSDLNMTFEISDFKDDRASMFEWFAYWRDHEIPMIGFNTVGFDYPVLHQIYSDPYISVQEIYDHAMTIINSSFGGNRFGYQIFESDRFAPQIDLFKIHHFDNPAKSTSLKALQFAMRSESVLECPVPFGILATREQIDRDIIPYNGHDTGETKRFAHISMDAIRFRLELKKTLHGDVLNFNDTKIGAKILEQRLGDEICYERDSDRRRSPRQTYRTTIPLNDIIFPYISFVTPEFNRILAWMRTQTLAADELTESIKTKGVFANVSAHVGGLDFYFGTGGIHGSVEAQRFAADAEWSIEDIDVKGLYPDIAIQNRLAPEHLGQRFVEEYAKLPEARAEHKKGTTGNALYKLAANGTYGNSNNQYSVFYDPKFTMTITINGQLLLCMLAEGLLTVPTVQIIQINTDGITYRIRRDMIERAEYVQKMWERFTRLTLEGAHYSRMWIRDVNNYVGEFTDGKLKQKGAYWFPRKWPDDISNSSPPAWHKDYSAQVSIKAAVEHMVTGVAISDFIYGHAEPFDFMCRAKVDRSSRLMMGEREVQRITRYYVTTNGDAMRKVSPPTKGNRVGDWKRRNGLSDFEYQSIAATVPAGQWDGRIHTKNKSLYEIRETSIESGYRVTECNVASTFDFENLNYQFYIDRATKLVVP